MKEFCAHAAFFVRDVHPGVGDAVEHCVIAADLIVEDAEATDDSRVDVRQQQKRNGLLLGEFLERFQIVVGNGVNGNVVFSELAECIAQLSELRPAGGSPDSRPVEHHNGLSSGSVRMKVDRLPACSGQGEVRQASADFGPRAMTVWQARPCRVPQGGRRIKPVLVALDRHLPTPVTVIDLRSAVASSRGTARGRIAKRTRRIAARPDRRPAIAQAWDRLPCRSIRSPAQARGSRGSRRCAQPRRFPLSLAGKVPKPIRYPSWRCRENGLLGPAP